MIILYRIWQKGTNFLLEAQSKYHMMKNWIFLIAVVFLLQRCTGPKKMPSWPDPTLPKPSQEFRAAWVASVANINWPSKPGLSVELQKAEAIALLDLLADHNYNAVVLQVRPQCDALYPSKLEPWSYYLTGQQGIPPEPTYDPLLFWIDSAHARGLELHAWLNPYRAHHTSGGEISSASIINQRPDLALSLKNGFWWLDPANPKTQDHSFEVVLDLVKRYDIDGIHFDDYFYPYPSYNENEEFPDSLSWKKYLRNGGKLTRDDWRRESVNTFIKRVYKGIKKEKYWVKFGISPFGIWRPNHPESIQGFDQYAKLYADAKLWLNKGWLDYWTPQLYWPINQIPQSFPVLLNWWIHENRLARPIWPGLSIGRIKGKAGQDEVINQIMITRGMLPAGMQGSVHWSIAPLVQSDSLAKAIHDGPYRQKVLVPPMNHLKRGSGAKPTVNCIVRDGIAEVRWQDSLGDASAWILYSRYNKQWQFQILCRNTQHSVLPLTITNAGSPTHLEKVTIVKVNRTGQFSISETTNLSDK